jgi:hypothetical protein
VAHTGPAEEGDDNAKLLGVYSTEELALARIERARLLPGFADLPEGFEVVGYKLDKDEWLEGFTILDGVHVPVWLPDALGQPRGEV